MNFTKHVSQDTIYELSVVSLPVYTLVAEFFFNASDCRTGDLEILRLYYTTFLQELLCNVGRTMCTILIEATECEYIVSKLCFYQTIMFTFNFGSNLEYVFYL